MNDEVFYERCAGIGVHNELIMVCLRIEHKSETRGFGTFAHEIRGMVAWLKDNGCQMVAMESAGPYWKALYSILEHEGLPVMVCNTYHMKNVPSRKTDVNDAQRIARCLRQGLLNSSFIPGREQNELRSWQWQDRREPAAR